jgi:N-acetylglutamate synthase-like GNAT family acetyltransferase
LDAIFAFRYVAGFFAKVGFDEVDRCELMPAERGPWE